MKTQLHTKQANNDLTYIVMVALTFTLIAILYIGIDQIVNFNYGGLEYMFADIGRLAAISLVNFGMVLVAKTFLK